MRHPCRFCWMLFGGVAIAFVSSQVRAITVPVTTNLFVNLNGDSSSNFVSNGSLVQAWKDLAENGSEASRQDFGQATAARQPGLVTGVTVPNSANTGITFSVLDFDRSATVNN